ncbi:MAG: AAA family ATPase [Caldilineaceae bacterium]|nr:AAA family ATPase [Caldilineaceae bacterium]
MTGPILATKLYKPAPRPEQILRTRLHSRLTQGLSRKLTLISAPAGFGKTTLLAGWFAELHGSAASNAGTPRVAWVSLDARDRLPARFLTYVVAALQTVDPDPADPSLGRGLLAQLQAPQPPSMEAVLTSLLNQIALLGDEIILVLDDFHLAGCDPIDAGLAFLLEHLPPQMHLILTTREDPPLPLARYRARGQLTEIRADDLRFTPAEAADFLRQMGLHLEEAEIAALEQRTEGWIAGLQLAALSLQGRTDVGKFLQAFTGSHRFVLDYLIDEVLEHQPEEVRDFLLQTSILERLSGPLCDAVCSRHDGQTLLAALERDNLFVVPLDDERRWYRYHHLFAEVLQVHLLAEQPDRVPDLHQRASAWYEQNEQPANAIHHAFAARDFVRAARLIELAWPAIFNGFAPATWLDWVRELPDALVRTRPVLSVGYAWTLLDCGELQDVDAHLDDAARWLDTSPTASSGEAMVVVNHAEFQSLPSTIVMGRAYLARARGDEAATVKFARQALDLLPPEEHYWRGIAAMFLGLAHQSAGELDAAYQYFAGSVASLHKAGHVHFQLVGTVALADILVAQGRLHEAVRTYTRALHFAAAQGTRARQAETGLHVGLGELHLEQGDLAQVEDHLQRAEELADHVWSPATEARLCVVQARLMAAQGDIDAALELLNRADQASAQPAQGDLRPLAAWRTRLLLRQGNLPGALAWVRTRGLKADDACSYRTEFEHITLARVRMAEYAGGRAPQALHEALDLLARLLDAAEAGGRDGSVIEILVLQARAHQEGDDIPAAVPALMRALALAEPQGYVHIFAAEGRPMQTLLAECLAGGADASYVTRLLAAITPTPDGELAAPAANQLLVEPLSARELDVLHLLDAGYSNQAIADELVIAVSTVKKHVNNIFGKLGVTSRTQAVSHARKLALL